MINGITTHNWRVHNFWSPKYKWCDSVTTGAPVLTEAPAWTGASVSARSFCFWFCRSFWSCRSGKKPLRSISAEIYSVLNTRIYDSANHISEDIISSFWGLGPTWNWVLSCSQIPLVFSYFFFTWRTLTDWQEQSEKGAGALIGYNWATARQREAYTWWVIEWMVWKATQSKGYITRVISGGPAPL